MAERPFPCIGCLEPLENEKRVQLYLEGNSWFIEYAPLGNWCCSCAFTNMEKRNLRIRSGSARSKLDVH